MTDRILKYEFKTPDPRNYIFNAVENENDKLEVATIIKPVSNTVTTKTTSASPVIFKISYLPPILDQGNIGSCVANAFAFCIAVQTKNNVKMSRLYHYANSRILDSTPLKKDDGTTILTACAAIKNYGATSEQLYPYNISVFSKFPPLTIYQGAKYFKTFSYTFVSQNLTSFKNCLNTYNIPIIFGFLVYTSFMTNTVSKTGIVPTPNTTKEKLLGGHCMAIVGYNDTTQMFTCVNSWGSSWGEKGYCYIPYNYLLNSKLARDFCFPQFVY